MTNEEPDFENSPTDSSLTEFAPDPEEMSRVFPVMSAEQLSRLKTDLDPLELGGELRASDEDPDANPITDASIPEESFAAVNLSIDLPEGYLPPQFDSWDRPNPSTDVDSDLDALFAALAVTAPGPTTDVAVWCPWILDDVSG